MHSIEVEENGYAIKDALPCRWFDKCSKLLNLDMNNDHLSDLIIYDIYSNRFIVLKNNQENMIMILPNIFFQMLMVGQNGQILIAII